MPVIREAGRGWLEGQVRGGLLPASAGGQLEELAAAVHDRRYGLGPLSAYLRDPHVENVDINGCDQVWISYATGERVAGPPVAASDDELIAMVRTWATRGGQTARDFSAAAPLVNVALTGGARLTATMLVTPHATPRAAGRDPGDGHQARRHRRHRGRVPKRRGPQPLQHHRQRGR
jgi:hypothetical protein